jgi:hypothetical protein
MDSLEVPHIVDRHTFYLSSCESGTGIDIQDSNKSSRNSSTSSSSFSTSNVAQSTTISSIETNSFLTILKRLHCLKLRRQKHGRYRTLSSSLHIFFKTHHHPSENQFFKSPSYPQLSTPIPKYSIVKKSKSCNQLHLNDVHKTKQLNLINRRLLLRASYKTVSEDNNTNTMSSLDLATIPQTVLITDANSSAVLKQSIDIQCVSDLFFYEIFEQLDLSNVV